MKTYKRSGVEDHRAPAAPLPLYLSLCSPLLSHPFPLSFIPPSVPSSPSTLLSSSLFHYLPPLPLSAFMLLLIIALTSLPPSLHPSDSLSPTGVGLHPCVSAWTGPGEKGRGRRSRWTDSELQRRGKRWRYERGRQKEEGRRGEENPGVCNKKWKELNGPPEST